jgi:uncharacterized integral membrane protein
MLLDRKGSDLLEWIVGIVIVLAVLGGSLYALFSVLGARFDEMRTHIPSP